MGISATSSISTNSTNLAKTIIKEFEGLRLKPYTCSGGKKTIGYGHVLQAGENHTQISTATAEKLLEQDIAKTKAEVHKYCKVPISPEQEAALISFVFNCGSGAFQASTLRQKLNHGEYELAADEFPQWVHAKGIKLEGLVNRRLAERKLFLNGLPS